MYIILFIHVSVLYILFVILYSVIMAQIQNVGPVYSFLARHLLITFANSLDPDQGRQNVGSDLNPNRLTL